MTTFQKTPRQLWQQFHSLGGLLCDVANLSRIRFGSIFCSFACPVPGKSRLNYLNHDCKFFVKTVWWRHGKCEDPQQIHKQSFAPRPVDMIRPFHLSSCQFVVPLQSSSWIQTKHKMERSFFKQDDIHREGNGSDPKWPGCALEATNWTKKRSTNASRTFAPDKRCLDWNDGGSPKTISLQDFQ